MALDCEYPCKRFQMLILLGDPISSCETTEQSCATVVYRLQSSSDRVKADSDIRQMGVISRLRDKRARTIIASRLMRLAEGLPGDVEPVGEGVSELRIHYGPGYRVYFQRRGNLLIVLLCGGSKGSQDRDIAAAKRLAKEWSDHDD